MKLGDILAWEALAALPIRAGIQSASAHPKQSWEAWAAAYEPKGAAEGCPIPGTTNLMGNKCGQGSSSRIPPNFFEGQCVLSGMNHLNGSFQQPPAVPQWSNREKSLAEIKETAAVVDGWKEWNHWWVSLSLSCNRWCQQQLEWLKP